MRKNDVNRITILNKTEKRFSIISFNNLINKLYVVIRINENISILSNKSV